MPDLVLADTSCLIALTRIDSLHLLHQVYDDIGITQEIKEEFKYNLPQWIRLVSPEKQESLDAINLLDAGEASAIIYCLSNPNCLLIIDDGKGRMLAKRMGIKLTGTLGLLVKAKQKGVIVSVKPYLELLEKAEFRSSAKIKELILRSAGE